MNKVVTINLGGKAYQVEEEGYNKLRDYLNAAERTLATDPDKAEIIADLERAIADKLEGFLNHSKNVVIGSEAEAAIKEMGPVEGSKSDKGEQANETKSNFNGKRLYQIREGAMIAGVCNGLAAYFNVDVTLVRLLFVALAVLTHGAWILVYVIMVIVLPHANTSAEKAAAFGQPFTAQDLVSRAREEYAKFSNKSEWRKWKHEWRTKMRQQRREMRQIARENRSPLSPVIGLLVAGLTIAWIYGLVTLISTGMLFGLTIIGTIPLWIAILIWICVYSLVTGPLRALRSMSSGMWGHHHESPSGFFEAIVWIAFLIVCIWALWQYVPESHPFFDRVTGWWAEFSNK